MADLTFRIYNQYPFLPRQCRDYLLPEASDSLPEITDSREENPEVSSMSGFSSVFGSSSDFSASGEDSEEKHPGFRESLSVYREIARLLPLYQGFLLHAVVIDADGTGIAFVAKSGTGKSTHADFWKKRFGDRVTIINGDKPILRLCGDRMMAYGTPWAGKEGLNENRSCVLKKICFLERAKENRVEKIEQAEGIRKLAGFAYTENEKDLENVCTLLSRAAELEYYCLLCTNEPEAADVSARALASL